MEHLSPSQLRTPKCTCSKKSHPIHQRSSSLSFRNFFFAWIISFLFMRCRAFHSDIKSKTKTDPCSFSPMFIAMYSMYKTHFVADSCRSVYSNEKISNRLLVMCLPVPLLLFVSVLSFISVKLLVKPFQCHFPQVVISYLLISVSMCG